MHWLKYAFLFFGFLLWLTPNHGLASESKYYIPPERISSTLQVTGEGAKIISGLFSDATGSFSYDEGTKTISRLRLAIDARSLNATKAAQAKNLEELFNPYMFTEIAFSSTAPATLKDGMAEIVGTLTLHGQSKPMTLKATMGAKSSERSSLPLSLSGSVKYSAFGMEYAVESGEETQKTGDTIAFSFDISALGM